MSPSVATLIKGTEDVKNLESRNSSKETLAASPEEVKKLLEERTLAKSPQDVKQVLQEMTLAMSPQETTLVKSSEVDM